MPVDSSTQQNTPPSETSDCSIEALNSWVDFNMRDYYYFADQTPVVNLADYDSPEKLIRDLRVLPNDKFSYVTTIEANNNLFVAGVASDLGFTWRRDNEGKPRLAEVYPDSPFGRAGATRGDILVSLNGTPWNDTTNEFLVQAYGSEDDPKLTTWVLQDAINNDQKTLSVKSTEYRTDTVLHYQTFSTPQFDGNIGYLVFARFINNSEDELKTVFADFKTNNVEELILDLRYNGGGITHIARFLASLISGPDTSESLLIEYRRNSQSTLGSILRYFTTETNALNLKRVIILTTNETASSSEIVINSLKPYIDVVTIGTRTTGKPYISQSVEKCDRSMNALFAEGFNANGVSVLGGIAATCEAFDNPVQDYPVNDIVDNTDEVDSMVGSAIDYLHTGTCRVPEPLVASLRLNLSEPTMNRVGGQPLGDGL